MYLRQRREFVLVRYAYARPLRCDPLCRRDCCRVLFAAETSIKSSSLEQFHLALLQVFGMANSATDLADLSTGLHDILI